MSSHHIIRENQEPALIIANGEACSSDLLDQLLEWSPKIMVLDGAIERAINLGIKIDFLLGDFDHPDIDYDEIRKSQYPIEIVHTPDQEKTDLEKGIEYLIKANHKAVNIIWATGRRIDHTIANVTNIVKYKNQIDIVMYDDYSRIYPLLPLPNKFQKWYKANTAISLIPVGVAESIKTSNLKFSLTDERLCLAERIGNSNFVTQDGEVIISYEKGNLLLIESFE